MPCYASLLQEIKSRFLAAAYSGVHHTTFLAYTALKRIFFCLTGKTAHRHVAYIVQFPLFKVRQSSLASLLFRIQNINLRGRNMENLYQQITHRQPSEQQWKRILCCTTQTRREVMEKTPPNVHRKLLLLGCLQNNIKREGKTWCAQTTRRQKQKAQVAKTCCWL